MGGTGGGLLKAKSGGAAFSAGPHPWWDVTSPRESHLLANSVPGTTLGLQMGTSGVIKGSRVEKGL